MKKAGLVLCGLLVILSIGAAIYLWTPAAPTPSAEKLRADAAKYDARVIRDKWGVPHIYGKTDPDVGFGLAYAHAEDDWKTIQEALLFARGTLAVHNGKEGAITDYLMDLLRVWEDIDAGYETDLSAGTKALSQAYAAGLNLWASENPDQVSPGVLPITGKDIVAGFVSRTPFFYGLDREIQAITEGKFKTSEKQAALTGAPVSAVLFGEEGSLGVGSNAIAVAPSRAADGHTRLMVNSHQPMNGPVAWYEARLKSEEGWDIIGSLFPGTPLILHGATPDLGWAFTVNHPDLVDIFALEVDHPKKPRKYMFDGEWKDFEVTKSSFRVKLAGPFSLPIKRDVLWSVHGPALATEHGVFAIRHAAQGDLIAIDQWYQMNRSKNFESFKQAVARQGIPSFNLVYGDKEGHIAFFYNAKMPNRPALPEIDWRGALPGDNPDLLWKDFASLYDLPNVFDPASGYVVSANHTPFNTTAAQDNNSPTDYPAAMGIERWMTNRAQRGQELYGTDESITAQEFKDYKYDNRYSDASVIVKETAKLLALDFSKEPELAAAQDIVRGWSRSASADDRAAALTILTMRELFDANEKRKNVDLEETFRMVTAQLIKTHDRVDPKWSEVNRLQRGKTDLPLEGGPATLRAIYGSKLAEDGTINARGGDTYILYADWAEDGSVSIETIHNYGSATLDETSPHYDDQAPLFAAEQMKTPALSLEDLLKQATRDYRPGK